MEFLFGMIIGGYGVWLFGRDLLPLPPPTVNPFLKQKDRELEEIARLEKQAFGLMRQADEVRSRSTIKLEVTSASGK